MTWLVMRFSHHSKLEISNKDFDPAHRHPVVKFSDFQLVDFVDSACKAISRPPKLRLYRLVIAGDHDPHTSSINRFMANFLLASK